MTKTFRVKNYKAIEEVSITSGAGLVVLGGKNAQGKSSFLDGIREIVKFVGKRETPEPIRLGEDSAEMEIIDEARDRRYVRTFSRAKSGAVSSTVGVYALDGAKYENPAHVIAEDVGAELIDAAAFALLSARDQRDVLLRQVDLGIDLDALAREKKGVEDQRKLANAEVKRLSGALASMEKPGTEVPTEEISAAAAIEALQVAQTHNRAVYEASAEAARTSGRISELERELAQMRAVLESTMELAAKPRADVDALQAQLDDVEGINARVRAAKQYAAAESALTAAESNGKAEQAKLDALDEKKRAALSAAVFPDPLLSVDDEQVLYDGIPFTQVNSAKQLGIGFDIATLAHRDLKIGFIKNGDLLDDESLAEIEARAIERDYTILVERGRGDKGYILNDGELA